MRGRVVGRPGPDRDVHSCNTLCSRARDVGARESMRGMVGGPAAGEAEAEGQRGGRDKQAVSNLGIVKLEGGVAGDGREKGMGSG